MCIILGMCYTQQLNECMLMENSSEYFDLLDLRYYILTSNVDLGHHTCFVHNIFYLYRYHAIIKNFLPRSTPI